MGLGWRKESRQREFWVATDDLPDVPQHVFYEKLNGILREGGFDEYVESLYKKYYANGKGRRGIPPGIYFRMLFVGYFEGIDSQRGIAWRCDDSLSLRAFLDLASEFLLDARVYHADDSDGDTLMMSVNEARMNLERAGLKTTIDEAVADKGYHKNETLAACVACELRTYIPEQKRGKRVWIGKPRCLQGSFRAMINWLLAIFLERCRFSVRMISA